MFCCTLLGLKAIGVRVNLNKQSYAPRAQLKKSPPPTIAADTLFAGKSQLKKSPGAATAGARGVGADGGM